MFLINQTGRSAAGFFAASSDASRLLEMQKLHGQKTKDAQRDFNRLELEGKQLEKEIEKLKPAVEVQEQTASCSELLKAVEYHETAIADIQKSISDLNQVGKTTTELRRKLKQLEKIPEPPELLPIDRLSELICEIKYQIDVVANLKSRENVFKKLPDRIVVHETDELRSLVTNIHLNRTDVSRAKGLVKILAKLPTVPVLNKSTHIRNMMEQIRKVAAESQSLETALSKNEKSTKKLNLEITRYLDSNPTCTQCGQAITPAHWEAIVGGDHS